MSEMKQSTSQSLPDIYRDCLQIPLELILKYVSKGARRSWREGTPAESKCSQLEVDNQHHTVAVILAFLACCILEAPTNQGTRVGDFLHMNRFDMMKTYCKVRPEACAEILRGQVGTDSKRFLEVIQHIVEYIIHETDRVFEKTAPSVGRHPNNMSMRSGLDTLINMPLMKFVQHLQESNISSPIKNLTVRYTQASDDESKIRFNEPPKMTCCTCAAKYPTIVILRPGQTKLNSIFCYLKNHVNTRNTVLLCHSTRQQAMIADAVADCHWEIVNQLSPDYCAYMVAAGRAYCCDSGVDAPNGDTLVEFPQPCLVYWGQPSHLNQHSDDDLQYDHREQARYVFVDLSSSRQELQQHCNYINTIHRSFMVPFMK